VLPGEKIMARINNGRNIVRTDPAIPLCLNPEYARLNQPHLVVFIIIYEG
jgi:hypothetical protein